MLTPISPALAAASHRDRDPIGDNPDLLDQLEPLANLGGVETVEVGLGAVEQLNDDERVGVR